MYTLPQKPQTLLEILKTSCIAIKVTFLKVLPITLFFLLLMGVNIGSVFYLKEDKMMDQLVNLITYVLQIVAYACLYYRIILLIDENKNLEWGTHIKMALTRVFPFLGISLLWLLFLLPGILLVVFQSYFATTISFPVVGILAFLYSIYIFVKFTFSVPLVSIPGYKIWDAMAESAKLVSGNFFRTAFLMIGFFVFIMAVLCAVGGIFFILRSSIEAGILEYIFVIFLPIALICSPLIMQIYAVFTVVVMNDLQVRKRSTSSKLPTVSA
jgi:hypothetical protein